MPRALKPITIYAPTVREAALHDRAMGVTVMLIHDVDPDRIPDRNALDLVQVLALAYYKLAQRLSGDGD